MIKIIISIILLIGLFLWKASTTSSLPNISDKSSSPIVRKSLILSEKSIEDDEQNNKHDLKNARSDYQGQLDRDFKSLPIVDDLRNLTASEVHHTPEIIKNGGEVIGRIHDEAEIDSTKRVDAMSFFKRCTEDQQIAMAIRAVCLSKVYKLVPIWKIPTPLSDTSVTDEVSELALKLP